MNIFKKSTSSVSSNSNQSPLRKRMIWMLIGVFVLMGLIIGFNLFKTVMIKKYLAGAGSPPATVTTMVVADDEWQPQLTASGSLRAYRGVELSTEVNGLVKNVYAKSGMDVKEGYLLMAMVQDSDRAQLQALQAQADLAKVVNERDRQQLAIEAISKNAFDSSSADYKAKIAQVDQQAALVAKKNLKAPFSGRVGVVSINPGQFINSGDKIMTLQTIDPVFVDFTLPQSLVAQIKKDQIVNVNSDAFGDQTFKGKITAISPKVDSNTRNIQVEALVSNPDKKLLPGMFANLKIDSGEKLRYITVPQTAVTYNPYGSVIYIAKEGAGKDKDGKASLEAQQVFVTTGPTRGDQVAILKGIQVGDTIVTSGQLKLKNGTPLIVNNAVIPANNANPKPQE
ncbi:MexH family multidrug efflux RND transporter periplasmic adaptor subunit [Polynucleobacter sp. SHI8]|uniref:efflux RND transporter periplasmic adaptor subunit n=1 Tax=unclassified Polynucleobacter TaxID=2640945 RepID=UPI0024924661|nr:MULTISPECIES: efflux RND transporter periplasmic adaptor subunit [unclassified Polynucleobacter]BDW10297.1 MexH family multidrug efflux RND transporter periplasmic adaptor subunit [Polynucleobacter sp. SHI2]BDW12743.1 MexH family multidrug efflux RND transporter periplasmic adaptor subunit [Polynucleobacter sp. SHI8]